MEKKQPLSLLVGRFYIIFVDGNQLPAGIFVLAAQAQKFLDCFLAVVGEIEQPFVSGQRAVNIEQLKAGEVKRYAALSGAGGQKGQIKAVSVKGNDTLHLFCRQKFRKS